VLQLKIKVFISGIFEKRHVRPVITSRARHLQAAAWYSKASKTPAALDRAMQALTRDIEDPETSPEFRKASETKIKVLKAERYQIRISPDKENDDQEIMQTARRSIPSAVLLHAPDPGLEIAMLHEAFGEQEIIVINRSDSLITTRDLMGYYSSEAIGGTFKPGVLLRAMQEGKVLVLPASPEMTENAAHILNTFADTGCLVDEIGREHQAVDGSMLIILDDNSGALGKIEEAYFIEHDFTAWKPEPKL